MNIFKHLADFFRILFGRKATNEGEAPKTREPRVPPRVEPAIRQRVFHNAIFKDPFGNQTLTHEIDRIIVRKNGIFCIEDKDWSGDIYGFEDDGPWRQVLGRGDIVHSRPSPIKQNETHKDVLEEIIDGNENDYVIPVVVMAENNSPLRNSEKVINAIGLERFMRSHSSFDPELDDEEFEDLCATIEAADRSSTITHEEHVRNVRRNHPGQR